MSINTAMTLKDIALSHAAARKVLESYHLDYCCGGEQTLADSCRKARLDLAAVVMALAQARDDPQPGLRGQDSTLAEQAGFILGRHHKFTRAKLPRIGALLARIIERQGSAHAELKAVDDCFGELQTLLDSHMLREERVLLPQVEALDKHCRGEAPLPPGCSGAIEDLIRQSKAEHRAVGDLLGKIRALASDFAVPADACPSSTYRAAYQALEELENNLMGHIHQENNVLFPRVLRLGGKD